jgi:hypothetical protein
VIRVLWIFMPLYENLIKNMLPLLK